MWEEFKESSPVKKVVADGEHAAKETKKNAGKWTSCCMSVILGILMNVIKLVLFAPIMIFIEPIWTAIRGKSAKKRRLLG